MRCRLAGRHTTDSGPDSDRESGTVSWPVAGRLASLVSSRSSFLIQILFIMGILFQPGGTVVETQDELRGWSGGGARGGRDPHRHAHVVRRRVDPDSMSPQEALELLQVD